MFGHPEWETCALCGDTNADVDEALMAFASGAQVRYGHGPRCKDHVACRRRVDEAKLEWPLAEHGPAPRSVAIR